MLEEIQKIDRCRVSGFKSIRQADLALGEFNVVIGANGAGKSNLVSYFAFLQAVTAGGLESYVGRYGGPEAFLYLGPQQTKEIASILDVTTRAGTGTFFQRLEFQAPDRLFYSFDHARSNGGEGLPEGYVDGPFWIRADRGPDGSRLQIQKHVVDGLRVFHFHDTSLTAPIRRAGYIEDNRGLLPDGGNLAAFLYRLRETRRNAYQRIVGTIRLVAPFFDDFSLEPRALDPTRILLNWKQLGTDYLFGPHQLSDGTLRAMAIIALLLQPEEELPRLIVIDEPEIGLHPYALSVVVSLLRKASHRAQVLVATQSPEFVDECEPEDLICVERKGQESVFTRPDPDNLQEWLEEYSLGEIWRKNVIGGGPH
ncbi:hypothetical protein OJF2_10080 [Aquisphaera giovannonii]|uniref:ATPase AAA-type core domain-containing protein n=1 Tax=Aquisphaera giovannonii TaxID=406548 RepID=A0A5B9VXE1_9BACT|nr:AAA family ATPase [Aquisphaera giovannonii]QEH32531.1 hypothetical protein OJF2_10080 [Aquisphaera giovannonii]